MKNTFMYTVISSFIIIILFLSFITICGKFMVHHFWIVITVTSISLNSSDCIMIRENVLPKQTIIGFVWQMWFEACFSQNITTRIVSNKLTNRMNVQWKLYLLAFNVKTPVPLGREKKTCERYSFPRKHFFASIQLVR